jgi:hypothetical protein
MARLQACILMVLGLLAVCDATPFSKFNKLKRSLALAQPQDAHGRKLQECVNSVSMMYACTVDDSSWGFTPTVNFYSNSDCSGTAVVSNVWDGPSYYMDERDILATCTKLSANDYPSVAYAKAQCINGRLIAKSYPATYMGGDNTGCWDEEADWPAGERDPFACQCASGMTQTALAAQAALLCLEDCDDVELTTCDQVTELFAKDCASDCDDADTAAMKASFETDSDTAWMARCSPFTTTAAASPVINPPPPLNESSAATGMVFAALVSFIALLFA